jgi:hypothetical protein
MKQKLIDIRNTILSCVVVLGGALLVALSGMLFIAADAAKRRGL